jgi:hypothetical protein
MASSWNEELCLRPDAPERERGLGLDYLAVHLKQRVGEKIDRATRRLRVDDQVAALGQFETIGRVMPEIVICQLWILPCFADINGNPATIRQKFRPA